MTIFYSLKFRKSAAFTAKHLLNLGLTQRGRDEITERLTIDTQSEGSKWQMGSYICVALLRVSLETNNCNIFYVAIWKNF